MHPNLFATSKPQQSQDGYDDYVHPNSLAGDNHNQDESDYDSYVAPNQSKPSQNDGYHDYIHPSDSNSFAPAPSQEVVRMDYEHVVKSEMRQKEEPFVQPRIFKTRTNPNVLIYEYPYRLVIYERQPNGTWKFMGSEKKPS